MARSATEHVRVGAPKEVRTRPSEIIQALQYLLVGYFRLANARLIHGLQAGMHLPQPST